MFHPFDLHFHGKKVSRSWPSCGTFTAVAIVNTLIVAAAFWCIICGCRNWWKQQSKTCRVGLIVCEIAWIIAVLALTIAANIGPIHPKPGPISPCSSLSISPFLGDSSANALELTQDHSDSNSSVHTIRINFACEGDDGQDNPDSHRFHSDLRILVAHPNGSYLSSPLHNGAVDLEVDFPRTRGPLSVFEVSAWVVRARANESSAFIPVTSSASSALQYFSLAPNVHKIHGRHIHKCVCNGRPGNFTTTVTVTFSNFTCHHFGLNLLPAGDILLMIGPSSQCSYPLRRILERNVGGNPCAMVTESADLDDVLTEAYLHISVSAPSPSPSVKLSGDSTVAEVQSQGVGEDPKPEPWGGFSTLGFSYPSRDTPVKFVTGEGLKITPSFSFFPECHLLYYKKSFLDRWFQVQLVGEVTAEVKAELDFSAAVSFTKTWVPWSEEGDWHFFEAGDIPIPWQPTYSLEIEGGLEIGSPKNGKLTAGVVGRLRASYTVTLDTASGVSVQPGDHLVPQLQEYHDVSALNTLCNYEATASIKLSPKLEISFVHFHKAHRNFIDMGVDVVPVALGGEVSVKHPAEAEEEESASECKTCEDHEVSTGSRDTAQGSVTFEAPVTCSLGGHVTAFGHDPGYEHEFSLTKHKWAPYCYNLDRGIRECECPHYSCELDKKCQKDKNGKHRTKKLCQQSDECTTYSCEYRVYEHECVACSGNQCQFPSYQGCRAKCPCAPSRQDLLTFRGNLTAFYAHKMASQRLNRSHLFLS